MENPFDQFNSTFEFRYIPNARILPFVEKWPLMNPNHLALLIITYLAFIYKVGIKIMANRTAFHLKKFLVFYNTVKVINSAVLASKFICYIMEKGLFPRRCDHDDRTIFIIALLYWQYMVTKALDLVDTIIFVLRKKYSQITFLHVYHHVFMLLMTWGSLKYDPSDHWAFMALCNCKIHVLMYIYYGISAMGPEYAKYLWWKKYLTMLQLLQFFLIMSHIMIQTYITECPLEARSYWIGVLNIVLFIILFTDFFKRKYTLKNKGSVNLACMQKTE